MGPTIIFDKSAIQGLGQKALAEVGRYFYTVVPHVLLMETLADLSLKPDDLPAAQKKVADIANKVFPRQSIANEHYHTMCLHNLLGERVPMTRRPAVSGAKPVVATDGSKGMVIDVQPEHDAVLRWQSGQFNSDDMRFAIEWRKAAKGANLQEMKQALPSPPIKLKSADEVRDFVDTLLAQSELQEPILAWFLSMMKFDQTRQQKILSRWNFDVTRMLVSFAPYSYHCLRVQLIYYSGMLQGIFGTRSSNIVDLEYLYYMPFASVFSSGDKLHHQLAPLILDEDQSFVPSAELNKTLKELATERESDPDVNPSGNSIIQLLWQKHLNRDAIIPKQAPISQEQCDAIMEQMRPIMDALSKTEDEPDQRPRFPV